MRSVFPPADESPEDSAKLPVPDIMAWREAKLVGYSIQAVITSSVPETCLVNLSKQLTKKQDVSII